ncbi:hypothetical protein SCHPADRAFT_994952 [Schizopora paradoxa]|uniref:Histone chaperone RTT106/FACT complex subunit SPT16-like middle domain-containing protein n=1 Tax=Schizopora paradoxa TaxID=27342 RepID=A0A0H2RY40_9AGAM|nr:hypothetical protein SCHPADRAFT_994952 [Schizopora paradoxa]
MSYLDAIRASVPQPLLDAIGLPNSQAQAIPVASVEVLLQLVGGATCPTDLQSKHGGEWKEGQEHLTARVGSAGLGKRARADGVDGGEQTTAANGSQAGPSTKKAKVELDATTDAQERGEPRYTLHAISVSSPIRKKVDVTITTTSILLRTPSSSSSENNSETALAHPPIPLASLKRAFVVSNLGKNRNKPHWTVILTAADVASKRDASSQMQVVFGVDHAPNVKELFATTDHTKSSSSRTSHPKGTETLPLLEAFLAFLPPHVKPIIASETSQAQIFRSSSGQPYLDTYRAAKEGSLYFLAEGILWAESKPAEFFALEDLAPDSDDPSLGGVRTLSATGRTFSLYIRRWIREEKGESKEKGEDEDEGILVDETEFSMIEGREQDNVMQWVRRFKRKFGQRSTDEKGKVGEKSAAAPQSNGKVDKGKGKAPMTIEELDDDTDEEDEDFVASSEDESSSSDSEDSEGGGAGSGGEEEAEGEAENSDEEDEGDGDGDVEMEDEMTAERHPLLRPGAMPRMSKAAMDMAVAMVTHDLTNGEPEDEEDDELDE